MELVDIVDREGVLTGKTIDKSDAHKKGILHKVSVAAIINSDGKLLVQRRSLNKSTEPGKWDLSAAGHVDSKETSIEAILRETYEEIGIRINQLELKHIDTYICTKKLSKNCIINHYSELYIVNKDINLNDINIQESEIDSIKYISKEEFIDMLDKHYFVEAAYYCMKLLDYML